MKNLYTETMTLMKKTEEDINKRKNSPCLCIRIDIVNMSMLLKTIYGSNTISIKITKTFISEIGKKS